LPPLRPAAFFCAVVPPCEDEDFDEPELELLPPRLEEPDEFAMRAARCSRVHGVAGSRMR
jgi:hypothetical protein